MTAGATGGAVWCSFTKLWLGFPQTSGQTLFNFVPCTQTFMHFIFSKDITAFFFSVTLNFFSFKWETRAINSLTQTNISLWNFALMYELSGKTDSQHSMSLWNLYFNVDSGWKNKTKQGVNVRWASRVFKYRSKWHESAESKPSRLRLIGPHSTVKRTPRPLYRKTITSLHHVGTSWDRLDQNRPRVKGSNQPRIAFYYY